MSQPVKKVLKLNCSIEHAFRVFTEKMHLWWPASHRMSREVRSSMVLESYEGGAFYSLDPDGGRKTFGSVTRWQPPKRLVFSWALGRSANLETEVDIRFSQSVDGTVVELEHREVSGKGDAWVETSPGFFAAWTVVMPAFENYMNSEGVTQ